MSDNKSGFEIRADLLSLAEGLLESNINKETDATHLFNDNHPESKKDLPVRSITAQDVIEVAKQFNEFVNLK
tara:strand:- start:2107 stop:2322 length:216 start_codon:yes stop_codon:yes gene_type:complete